jgi:ribosomal protein S18 acetylase RimI-like enzyme
MSHEPNINLSFVYADFSKIYHQEMFAKLIAHYMLDPMGGGISMADKQQKQLVEGMKDHPSSFVLFACSNDTFIGLATCFVNFSTFKAKPFMNIHDVIVLEEFRGHGVGRKLMEKCIDIARERDYCKITLEVRDDNLSAMKLYKSLGFDDVKPIMHFWTKTL